MKYKLDYYKIFGYSLIPIDIILFILFGLDIFGKLPVFWNSIYIFYIFLIINTIFLTLRLKKIPEDKRENDSTVFWAKYLFLLGLIVLVVNQFLKRAIIINYQYYIIGVVIALGFLAFFASKNRVEREIEDENTKEEENEKRRKEEFEYKFPRINRIWGLRNIVKWMYGHGFIFILLLLIIVIIGFFILVHNLGAADIRDDELYAPMVAYNFIQEGNFYLWDWILDTSGKNTNCVDVNPYCNYVRAWPYSLTVALSYEIFGVSEFSTRFPGVIFGTISIILIYFISLFFLKNKIFSLISSILFTFSPMMIIWSRFARMYSLLIPLFLLMAYFFYRGLIEKNTIKTKNSLLNRIFLYFDFNYKYLFLGFLFFVLCYEVHVGSLIIIPFLFLFVNVEYIITKERRYLSLLKLSLILFLIAFIFLNSFVHQIIISFINLGEMGYRIRYMDYLLNYPFFTFITLTLIILLGLFAIINYKNKISQPIFYLLIIVLGSLLAYTHLISTGLFIDSRYISFLIPFTLIIIPICVFIILKVFNNKTLFLLGIILIISLSVYSFIIFSHSFYDTTNAPKLEKAYSTILENYKPGELIVSNSLRTYYLRGINTTDIYTMEWRKGVSLDDFYKNLTLYDSGWVTWEVDKVGMHIRPEIYNYAEKNFKKYHGRGIDDTLVDVYYYNKSMLK